MQITKENFVQLFTDNFVPNVSVKRLKQLRCYAPKHGYLWGVCELNLVHNLKKSDAMCAYDYLSKKGAVLVQYDNGFGDNDTACPLPQKFNTASGIEGAGLMEAYVIGQDFSWCYIVTHEPTSCGPYLILK